MSQKNGLNRRAFLKNAGMTTLAGPVGTGTSMASGTTAIGPPESTYDFDEIYNRVGTDSVKWDRQMERFGEENIDVGMGIADMDFRAAPCVTKALAERCHHENWGYLRVPPAYSERMMGQRATLFLRRIGVRQGSISRRRGELALEEIILAVYMTHVYYVIENDSVVRR